MMPQLIAGTPRKQAQDRARDLLTRDAMEPFAPHFAEATGALGRLAGSQPGDAMVSGVR